MIRGWSWLTGSGSGGGGNAFGIIQTPAGTAPTATTSSDTLNLTSSDNSVTITGNSATKTVDFTVAGGSQVIVKNQTGTNQNIYSNLGGVPAGTKSIVIGTEAINSNTFSGTTSVLIGYQVGTAINGSPSGLTVLGANSGPLVRGNNNTIVGSSSATLLTTGTENILAGSGVAIQLTTGALNVGIGSAALPNLTTGTRNISLGNNSGVSLTTGSNNIFIGESTGVSSGSLVNTICIGAAVTANSSNVMLLGGTTNPVNVGINNNSPAHRLDIDGDVNIPVGNFYRIGGSPFQPWNLDGNAGLTSPANFLGTTDAVRLDFKTNNVVVGQFTITGLFGVSQTTPTAIIHGGARTETVSASPSSLSVSSVGIASSGYAFGSGNKDYAVYTGRTVGASNFFSTSPATTTFFEPNQADFDVVAATVGSQDTASTGYDPLFDPPPSYQIWAIYNNNSKSITPYAIALPSWPVITPNQDVLLQWTAPVSMISFPTNYFIVRNGADYKEVFSGVSLLDDNTGWTSGSTPGVNDIHYNVTLIYSPAIADANFYRVLNTTDTTFFDDTGLVLSVTDDSLWTSGSTVTPNSYTYTGIKTDSDAINIATARTVTTSTDPGTAGDICWDNDYIYVAVATDTWKRVAITTY